MKLTLVLLVLFAIVLPLFAYERRMQYSVVSSEEGDEQSELSNDSESSEEVEEQMKKAVAKKVMRQMLNQEYDDEGYVKKMVLSRPHIVKPYQRKNDRYAVLKRKLLRELEAEEEDELDDKRYNYYKTYLRRNRRNIGHGAQPHKNEGYHIGGGVEKPHHNHQHNKDYNPYGRRRRL